MTIEVVKITTCPDWGKKPGDIRIDRRSKWGNPYPAKKHTVQEHNRVIALYKEYLDKEIIDGNLNIAELAILHQRHGNIRLGCWCKPLPCHGDVLKAYIEAFEGDE